MRNALTLAPTLMLAAGLTLGISGAAQACNWNKTASKEMTVAEVKKPTTETAVTTFEPVREDQLEEKIVDKD